MWRRTYLILVLVRLYFAFSASYLHPDEHFQGPEIIANRVFGYPAHLSWEFTTDHPIRSSFPLWIAYGAPMYVLRLLWDGLSLDEVPPRVVFYVLRGIMFLLSFILEDWAIHELVQPAGRRQHIITLVASSYVTWTYQTHTFSNALETTLVLWTLVLAGRITGYKYKSSLAPSAVLGITLATGVFNRITFPLFVVLPSISLIPHFIERPWSFVFFAFAAATTTALAVITDTVFYHPTSLSLTEIVRQPLFTPYNNIMYNLDSANLADHGLHPLYQHFLINLPQLIGPAFPLLFFRPQKSLAFYSALVGIAGLSFLPHQEARFLLPAVPLLLASIHIPRRIRHVWIGSWIVFNASLGVLMGIFHQGGVVPTQIHLSGQQHVEKAIWWKTYSPPRWLLDGQQGNMTVVDLMGAAPWRLMQELEESLPCDTTTTRIGHHPGVNSEGLPTVCLVAPRSVTFLDTLTKSRPESKGISLAEQWVYPNHVHLDDMDFGDDGVWPTLRRVIGRHGLSVWEAKRNCSMQGVVT